MSIDEAIQMFAEYARGNGDFDELDLKEVIADDRARAVQRELKGIMGTDVEAQLNEILKSHALAMLNQNGREDCKNCSLAETIQEWLEEL